MSQYVETPTKAMEAGGAIGLHLRVKFSSGKIALAGISDKDVGVAEAQAFASGEWIAVRLPSAQGTVKMIAAGAIAQGATVCTAASGKVNVASALSLVIGVAMEAASANGDTIEVQRTGFVDTPLQSLIAGGALAINLRVKFSSGKLALAGITDKDIGVVQVAAAQDLDVIGVRLPSAPGTVNMVAAAAIAQGAVVFTAASGKVSVSATTAFALGIAMEAASGNGEVLEVLRTGFGDTAVS